MARRRLVDVDDNYLACRELRHPWEWRGDLSIIKRGSRIVGWERVLICPRCDTQRAESIEADGRKSPGRYTYPEGYQLHGIERPTKAAVRLEWIRRATEKGTR